MTTEVIPTIKVYQADREKGRARMLRRRDDGQQ
jgi:hypothetical protein